MDVYSLGIVAYELYRPFRTYMEKMHLVMRARQGIIDEATVERFPQVVRISTKFLLPIVLSLVQAEVIKSCVSLRPDERPSASALLAVVEQSEAVALPAEPR